MVNLGGPDSLAAVRPFLYNLFSDPDIIRLPFSWLMQKPLAWYITMSRLESVKDAYRKMGNRSPILPLTQAQASALEDVLTSEGHPLPVYIAMRYWHPFTDETVNQMRADGISHIIVLPLYPHYSLTTTGSSVNELQRVLTQKNIRDMTFQVLDPYYDHPDFQAAMAETITEGLAENIWSCPRENVQILFSAHSLPKKFVKKTRDIYPDQIVETCKLLIQDHFPQNPWELAYQSKVGKMPWLGPDTEGVIHYFAANHIDNILMVPVSFVSDHLETLYEIDQLYLPLARELKIPHAARTPALNSRPKFIQTLATLVKQALLPARPESTSGIPH